MNDERHVNCFTDFFVVILILIPPSWMHDEYIFISGFHSGPVVSNVIGSLNPRYGLFGDTGTKTPSAIIFVCRSPVCVDHERLHEILSNLI